jgi:DUF4097 and DUF4098 domain-containing protein YvlB
MKKIAFFCLIFLFSLSAAFAAQSRETLRLPAAGVRSLHIECGAGSLKVQGKDNLEQIEVDAVLVVNGIAEGELPEFRKEHVTLTLEKSGDKAILTSSIESDFSLATLFSEGRHARIDLDVRLPRRLALAVADGSGDCEIRDSDGGLALEDGSGDTKVTNIKGAVKIEDGSGDLYLADIGANVTIDDGSGDIMLRSCGGDVSISDGSGQTELRDIRGSIWIDDGSGDIIIDGAEKDVTIDEAGSGAVEIRNVKGKVKK